MSFGFGLLGEKLAHSYSPIIHNSLGAYEYGLYDISPEELDDFMKNGTFSGLNVTAPYKKEILKYVKPDPPARRLGAVNTIYHKDGVLRGTNTDYYGFMYLLSLNEISLEGKKVLILGTGGASSIVRTIAKACGAQVFVASRQKSKDFVSYNTLPKDVQIIVNTTPVGSYPNSYESIIDLKGFTKCEVVIDLIYNPARTPLLLQGEKAGIKTVNGLSMLVAQALKSAEYFTGMDYCGYIKTVLSNLEIFTKNIIITGMPGSGKTTVGREVAKLTGRQFVDIDEEVEKKAGKNIPQIFAEDGEEVFRSLETEILREFCKEHSLVIAAGGGSILCEENRDYMRCNSFVAEIKREFDLMPKEGRPISQKADSLKEIYKQRKKLYDNVKDFTVENDMTPEVTANRILDNIGG